MIWFANIESKVFTIVKTRMTKKYKDKYPTMEFVAVDDNRTPKNSPTIYLHELNNPEISNDLMYNKVLMVRENMESEVYAKNRGECHMISALLREEMKALGFAIIQQSPPMTDDTWWRCIARYSRPIGGDDLIK